MEAVNTLTVQKALQKAWQDIDIHAETHIFETVDQAVDFARGLDLIDGLQWKVLITGSLHLIGGILGVIDPKVE
jgi:folylpolyglutamate synthase